MNAIAYTILVRALISTHGRDSEFAARIGGDIKGYISLAIYILAVGLSFVNSWISLALYFGGRDDLVHSGSPLRAVSAGGALQGCTAGCTRSQGAQGALRT